MSVRQPNATSQKILRGNSIPNNKNKVKPNPIQTKKAQNKDSKLIDKKRNLKVDDIVIIAFIMMRIILIIILIIKWNITKKRAIRINCICVNFLWTMLSTISSMAICK